MNNPYEVLGAAKNADEKALKSAYRKLAMQYHPDRNPGDDAAETKFKEINEAYDVLKDPQKRAAYDQYGEAAFQGGHPSSGGGQGQGFGGFGDVFEEMFGDFMGGGRGRQANNRGADLQYRASVTLNEAFNGVEKEIQYSAPTSCTTCSGSGCKPGSSPKNCGTCNGRGRVRVQQGFFAIEQACGACHGVGSTIETPCGSCRGTGTTNESKNIKVTIPAGIEDGMRIRLPGKGEAGRNGGPSGDLFLVLAVSNHDLFQREGEHLFMDIPMSISTAALGGEIEIPVIDGTSVKVKIPAGTQSSEQLRLRGKGMSIYNRKLRGDLYLNLNVETPTSLSKKQKELLQELAKEEAQNSGQSNTAKFMKKIKSFLG